ncbi:MAG: bifunctional folylpolyglutamate synthase/dihydrofolate synthase [Alphaproteobacteria bacterium]|nr:bifunctional folylpolyglutamate synthase/dihydrofolate synthase [Alphaproteobacteria bacterium]
MKTKIHTDMMRLLKQMENPYLRAIDLQLVRMVNLMNAIGRPDKKLPPVIHVAGTNGKGSLMAYLRAIYEEAGKAVHVYTSPHLVRFNERIVLAGKEVEDAELYDALRRVHQLNQQFPATLFEAVTAAAFILFAKHKADLMLVEVGMGGRLDATNVLEHPAVSMITPVSIDHSEYLGKDIAAIAREKAGIMKKDVPCVIGPQSEAAMALLSAHALKVGTPLMRYGIEWHLEKRGESYWYKSDSLELELPKPSLAGTHQWQNAATAVAAVDVLNRDVMKIDQTVIQSGIPKAFWEGRLQQLSGKWLDGLPAGSEVWLDGGHNPAAGEILAQWAKERWQEPQLHMVSGMLKGKDVRGFLTPLAPLTKHLWAVPIHDEPNALMPGELEHKAKNMGMKANTAHHVREALQYIGESSDKNTPQNILITGSLYLVGQVIAEGV